MSAATANRRGRPRDESIDAAILDAAIDELTERGFIAVSMESIAARAGVAKTTLYRRWSNVDDIALEAMRTFDETVQEPPAGSVRAQLLWMLDAMRRKWGNPRYAALMRRVAADGTVQPEVYRHTRDKLITPYLRLMEAILRRGVDEGLLRADADLGWLRQLLTGPVLANAMTLKGPVSRAQIEVIVDTVLRGAAPLAG